VIKSVRAERDAADGIDTAPVKPTTCGIHGTPVVDKRCVDCDRARQQNSGHAQWRRDNPGRVHHD